LKKLSKALRLSFYKEIDCTYPLKRIANQIFEKKFFTQFGYKLHTICDVCRLGELPAKQRGTICAELFSPSPIKNILQGFENPEKCFLVLLQRSEKAHIIYDVCR